MDGPVGCEYGEVTARQGKRRDAGDIEREWLNKKRDLCLLLACAERETMDAKERMGFGIQNSRSRLLGLLVLHEMGGWRVL
jgi:hypothetical protein